MKTQNHVRGFSRFFSAPHYFLYLFIAAAFVGCSKDDDGPKESTLAVRTAKTAGSGAFLIPGNKDKKTLTLSDFLIIPDGVTMEYVFGEVKKTEIDKTSSKTSQKKTTAADIKVTLKDGKLTAADDTPPGSIIAIAATHKETSKYKAGTVALTVSVKFPFKVAAVSQTPKEVAIPLNDTPTKLDLHTLFNNSKISDGAIDLEFTIKDGSDKTGLAIKTDATKLLDGKSTLEVTKDAKKQTITIVASVVSNSELSEGGNAKAKVTLK